MANDTPGSFDFDRERGIFTPRDRRFLAGELDDELEGNERRQKRYRLRKRVLNALQDLHYLGAMERADTNAIGETLYNNEEEKRRFNSAVHELMNYFYDLYGQEGFIDLLEFALEWRTKSNHYTATGQYADVDVEVNVTLGETMSIEELAKLSSERPLTPIEKIVLHEAGGHPAYTPRHLDLLDPLHETLNKVAEGEIGTDLGVDWDVLVDRVESKTGASRERVTETIEDCCLLGVLQLTGPGRVLGLSDEYWETASLDHEIKPWPP